MSSTARQGVELDVKKEQKEPIWWSNAIFFLSMHVLALIGILHLSPWYDLRWQTATLCIASWQLATFGITVGYHRLWSHRSFEASYPLRIVLAAMGCLGFQGSIKWWVLRHRLHHRFTDTESDPYNAKQGLYHSHMGWIFRKPNYLRMSLVDRKDLEIDRVVRFQHRYYLPLTLGLGLVLPTLIGYTYGDAMGGYIWGGVVARILIWHFTFLINSLAHYLGDQAYSEDVTARGNFLLAIFTGGEANHNYHHAFPRDYRNGPRALDWDPTKWLIYVLHNFTPFIPKIHQTSESDILKARAHVLSVRSSKLSQDEEKPVSSFKLWGSFAEDGAESDHGSATSYDQGRTTSGSSSSNEESSCDEVFDSRRKLRSRKSSSSKTKKYPEYTRVDLVRYLESARSVESKPLLVLTIHGYAVDVTKYANRHPGGYSLLRKYSLAKGREMNDATQAFEGQYNDHGWSAREKMKEFRIAKIVD